MQRTTPSSALFNTVQMGCIDMGTLRYIGPTLIYKSEMLKAVKLQHSRK